MICRTVSPMDLMVISIYISMLMNNGFDLKAVSEHLGYCGIGVTVDIHAEVLKGMNLKAAKQIELRLK